MKELTDIVAAWEAVRVVGREALLATVVGVSGSTYRRPGARMLFGPEGHLAGSVSGGCLEGDILKKAWWRTRDGAALVTYDSTDEDDVVWGFGLGCNGVVQVLLERVSSASPGPLDLLRSVLTERQPGVVATIIGSDGAARVRERLLLLPGGASEDTISDVALLARVTTDAQAVLASGVSRTESYALVGGGTADVFFEAVLPPLPLVIFGANHDAVPLVRLAKELGWHVTVIDTRGARARPERFLDADTVLAVSPDAASDALPLDSRTAAVVMTHNYPDDRRVLRTLLQSPVGYVGQLGPKARTERLLAEISDDGFSITADHRRRLHGPVGLDLGADNPEEIALSIIAEIQAARAGREGGLLRDRRAPLHPPVSATVPSSPQAREHTSVSIGLILLAAGGSRRLGTPKQLLRDGTGRSLVQLAAQAALASACRPIVAVLGASLEAVGHELAGLPLQAIVNPDWQTGLASSLRAGLDALSTDAALEAVVVMLCDQPKVTGALLDSLVAAYHSTAPDIVACEYGDVWASALFGRAAFGALSALNSDEGARHVIRKHDGPITRVPFPEGLFDIDTPQDAQGLCQA